MLRILCCLLLTLALSLCLLLWGSAHIAPGDVLTLLWHDVCATLGGKASRLQVFTSDVETLRYIVYAHRLPQMLTASSAGAALAVGGLLMQSLFRNPLADPSLLGINSGASLGVALVLMGGTAFQHFALPLYWTLSLQVLAAFVGACLVLVLLLFALRWTHTESGLLVIGVMLSCLSTSLVLLLQFHSSHELLRGFLVWGMGSFSGLSIEKLGFFLPALLLPLLLLTCFVRRLDILLLGETYAASMGVNVGRSKALLLLLVGWCSAVVTAFCGPVAFIGLAAPHVASRLLSSRLHSRQLPATALTGAILTQLCVLLTQLPSDGALLPLGAITPLIGAPIVIALILKNK